MKKRNLIAISLCLFLTAGTLAQEKRPITIEDLFSFKRVGSPALSPDGKWVALTVTAIDIEADSGKTNIFLVPASGGEPKQLTSSGGDFSPVWNPDGKTIAFTSTRSGSGQVWLIDLSGGEARQLTNIPSGAGGQKWSPDGKQILFYSMVWPDCDDECYEKKKKEIDTRKTSAKVIDNLLYRHWDTWRVDGRKRHLFIVDAETGEHRDVVPDFEYDMVPFPFGGSGDYNFSPDGKEICFTAKTDPEPATHTNNDIFIVPAQGGSPESITEDLNGDDHDPVYSPNGRYIAFGSMERPRFEADKINIVLHDRSSGEKKNITADFDRTLGEWVWAPDSSAIYAVALDQGRRVIYKVPVNGGEVTRIVGEGYITNLNVSSDGEMLVFARRSLRYPTEIFRVSADGSGEAQLTHFTKPLLDQLELGKVVEHWFEGDRGDKVHLFIVQPPGFDPSKKWPLLHVVHGGPQQDYADLWTSGWNSQLFAAQGYVVALVAFHATPGYGQAFTDSVSRNWGGSPFEDVMKATDYLIEQGYINPEKMAIGGGSYGGYLVNWICSQTDRFKASVSHSGLFNLVSMYGATEELWFPEWELDGPYWTNDEYYKKWSPHEFVANYKTPTLISHGQLDYRVPVSQSFELFTALQRQGVPSRLIYYPDENHWILGTQNKMFWYEEFLAWMKKYIGTGPSE